MWYTMTYSFNKNLNGGTAALVVSNYASTATVATPIGTYTGQGDPTLPAVWGTTTPRVGFYGTTGG